MRNCLATKILSIVMMMLTPAAMLMAETSNTMLYASGTVTLNGTEVARSASVAPPATVLKPLGPLPPRSIRTGQRLPSILIRRLSMRAPV